MDLLRLLLPWLVALALLAPAGALAEEPVGEEAASEAAEEPEDALLAEGDEIRESFGELSDRIAKLQRQVDRAEGGEARVLEERLWRSQLQSVRLLVQFVDNVLAREKRGDDVDDDRRLVANQLKRTERNLPAHVAWREKRIRTVREAWYAAEGAEQVALATQLADQEDKLQGALRALIELVDAFEKIGLDASDLRSYGAEESTERAEQLADWIRVTRQEIGAVADSLKAAPDDAELLAQQGELETRLDRATGRLSGTIALLARLDVPAAEYQQLLIRTTGEITADILDRDVMLGLLSSWSDEVRETLTARGAGWLVKAFVFGMVLAAFWLLSGLVRRMTERAFASSKANVSHLLRDTMIGWSSRLVMMIGVLVALSQLGVQIGPLLAGLGIAGFIVGFALQDSLANFAAGAMILIYRPFDLGDVIESAGVSGRVSAMSLVSTTIHTFDNQTLIVPNNRIWGDVIRNVTAQKIRRVDLTFGVAYADDVEQVERVLHEVVSKHPKTLDDPEPIVKLHNLADSAMEFAVRPWVRTEDYWEVYWDLIREVKLSFDREGISIPFPQRDLHLRPPASE